MDPSHGLNCGCGFCTTLGRIRSLVLDPRRDPRVVAVATARLRVVFTLILDLVEGLQEPHEYPAGTLLTDPVSPPGDFGSAPRPARFSREKRLLRLQPRSSQHHPQRHPPGKGRLCTRREREPGIGAGRKIGTSHPKKEREEGKRDQVRSRPEEAEIIGRKSLRLKWTRWNQKRGLSRVSSWVHDLSERGSVLLLEVRHQGEQSLLSPEWNPWVKESLLRAESLRERRNLRIEKSPVRIGREYQGLLHTHHAEQIGGRTIEPWKERVVDEETITRVAATKTRAGTSTSRGKEKRSQGPEKEEKVRTKEEKAVVDGPEDKKASSPTTPGSPETSSSPWSRSSTSLGR